MEKTFITESEAKQLIVENGHKLFAVTFIKKDGTTRNMQVRTGSEKGLSSNPSASAQAATLTRKANHPNLINVRDVHAAKMYPERSAWRSVNLHTMESMRIGKRLYYLTHD